MKTKTKTLACRLLVLASLLATTACAQFQVREADLLDPDDVPTAASLPDGYVVEHSTIENDGRRIGVTFAHRPGNSLWVQYCGGNDFRRRQDGGSVLRHLARGADVVLFDYPGYGDSTGKPSVDTLFDDALAVYDHFLAQRISSDQVRALYGFSLGGFVASDVSARRNPDIVVLEATAPSVAAWADGMVPLLARPFVRVEVSERLALLDNVAALDDIDASIYVLGGGKDEQASAALGRTMSEALAERGADVRFELFDDAVHGGIQGTPAFAGFWDGIVAGGASASAK